MSTPDDLGPLPTSVTPPYCAKCVSLKTLNNALVSCLELLLKSREPVEYHAAPWSKTTIWASAQDVAMALELLKLAKDSPLSR